MSEKINTFFAKIEDINLNGYQKLDHNIIAKGYVLDPSQITDQDTTRASLAMAQEFGESDKQEDLLYVAFKLAHVGGNKNKDGFPEDQLKAAVQTPILKLLNWGHKEPNIGTIYASKFIEQTEDEAAHLLVAAAVSKFKYKEKAQEILQRYTAGELYFSMETWYKQVECSTCHEMFSYGSEYCDHLLNRFAAGSETIRYLHGIIFAGAGVVEVPADELALPISIAKKQKGGIEDMADDVKTYTEDQYNDLMAKLTEATTKIADLEGKVNDHETVVAEKDTALSTKDEEIRSLNEKLTQANESLETITQEFNAFKANIEAENNLQARLQELEALGYVLSEDKEKADAFRDKIKNMDDDTFAFTKELLASKKNDQPDKVDDDDDDTPDDTDTESDNDLPIGSLATGSGKTKVDTVIAGLKDIMADDKRRRQR